MRDLSLRVKKLWPMVKFFDLTDGQKEGWTDRVITIGHPPSGGALIKKSTVGGLNFVWYQFLWFFVEGPIHEF